jgi:hypothetical protein
MSISGIIMILDDLFIYLMVITFAIFFIIALIPMWICYHICRRINWKAIKNLYYLWWTND